MCFLAMLGLFTIVLVVPALALVVGLLSLVIGLLAAVLPFAFIGLLVWAACTALAGARWKAWKRFRKGTVALVRWGVAIPAAVFPRLASWGIALNRALVSWAVSGARQSAGLAQQAGQAGVAAAGWTADAGKPLAVRSLGLAGLVGNVLLQTAGWTVGVVKAGTVGAWTSAGLVGNVLLETVGGAAVGVTFVGLADLGDSGPDFTLRLVAGGVAGALIGLIVGVTRASRATRAC
jgi:hypothetical protein